MEPHKTPPSILLPSKGLKKITVEVIAEEVLNAMVRSKLLKFMIDGAFMMFSVG